MTGEPNGHGTEITARQIGEKFKIPYSTINHYTNLGLFSIVKKSGHKRIYDLKEVKINFEIISKLVHEGYPLHLIRKKIIGKLSDELL